MPGQEVEVWFTASDVNELIISMSRGKSDDGLSIEHVKYAGTRFPGCKRYFTTWSLIRTCRVNDNGGDTNCQK